MGEKDRLETDRTISSYCQQENVSGEADLVPGVTCDSMTVKEQEFASKEKERHLKQNRETNGQNGSASGTKSSSPKDAKTDAQGLPSPSNEPPSDQAYENQKKASATLSCNSPREEQSLAIHNAKKSTSRDNETNGQPSQRPRTLPTQKSRPSRVAGKGPSVEESARAAPKKFSLWGDNSKKEAHDPSMPNKPSSHKKLSGDQTLFNSKFLTASVLPEELSATGRTGGAKGITFRPEEAVAQSMSALNKLTNRLNFLKERRAQLDQHVPHHGSTPNAQRTEFR